MVRHPHHANGSTAEDLCLACGICCDGTLFADVKLQPGDDADKLQTLGLLITAPGTKRRGVASGKASGSFSQPCLAFRNCSCGIYKDRPKHCRDFECELLKGVKSGKTERSAAIGIIRTARNHADKVWRLLRELGDVDEELSLGSRFRRTTKRLEGLDWDAETAVLYGELTLAVQDLNVLLSEAFYPGDQ